MNLNITTFKNDEGWFAESINMRLVGDGKTEFEALQSLFNVILDALEVEGEKK